MSTQANVVVAARTVTTAPRGAVWFGQIVDAAQALARAVRASRQQLRREREAAAARRYADQLREVDPRIAAELHAAADRHAG
jgi:hypothetical protein